MTLNAGEMLVLQALETGLENIRDLQLTAEQYWKLVTNESVVKSSGTRVIERYKRDIVEIEAAIEIVKQWGEK